MGRAPRVDAPGCHHVTANAVDGHTAFADGGDAWVFGRALTLVVDRFGWSCVCYCLMGTHYHMLLFIEDSTLARGIHLLNSVYARRYNQRRNRRGHAFRARYSSVFVESQSHLLGTFRYIELNPVRAGLCADPAEWPWSSFRPLTGLAPAPPFLDVAAALSLFGRTPDIARSEYARFVRLGLRAA